MEEASSVYESLNTFFINVISTKGKIIRLEINPNYTIEMIKKEVIRDIYGNNDDHIFRHYLINLTNRRKLEDKSNVVDVDIREDDELLLAEVREPPLQRNLTVIHNLNAVFETYSSTYNYHNLSQFYIRKIIITMIRTAAQILAYSPHADGLYEEIKQILANRCKPIDYTEDVKALIDKGYSHSDVLKAMYIEGSNIQNALKWLEKRMLQYQNEADDLEADEVGFKTARRTLYTPNPKYLKRSKKKKTLNDAYIELCEIEDQGHKDLVIIVDLLLKSIRLHRRFNFIPGPAQIKVLMEMGFQEKDIKIALKNTDNILCFSCEQLLDEEGALSDVDEAYTSDDLIYKILMDCPDIPIIFTNPNLFRTHIMLLELPITEKAYTENTYLKNICDRFYHLCYNHKMYDTATNRA